MEECREILHTNDRLSNLDGTDKAVFSEAGNGEGEVAPGGGAVERVNIGRQAQTGIWFSKETEHMQVKWTSGKETIWSISHRPFGLLQ